MNFVCIVSGAVLIAAGILFALRKLLPRAWKEMPDEEKAKVRIKPLCINIGIMIMLCGSVLLIRGVCAAFAGTAFSVTMTVWSILCVADVLYISKSKRYRSE